MRDQHHLLLFLRMDEEANQQPSWPRGRRPRAIGPQGAFTSYNETHLPQHH